MLPISVFYSPLPALNLTDSNPGGSRMPREGASGPAQPTNATAMRSRPSPRRRGVLAAALHQQVGLGEACDAGRESLAEGGDAHAGDVDSLVHALSCSLTAPCVRTAQCHVTMKAGLSDFRSGLDGKPWRQPV